MTVKPLFFDSYITAIKKSVGSKLFQTLWAEVDGKRKDITRNGELSCSVFVSAILLYFGLIKERHATVKGTIESIRKSGWKRIRKPRPGAILLWEPQKFSDGYHSHLGFYIGNKRAISNHWKARLPIQHHWTFGTNKGKSNRKIIGIYWHPRLKSKYF